MKFGLFTSLGGMTWPTLQSLWQHLEATGWDAACVADHFMPNVPDPVEETLECWTALAGLAVALALALPHVVWQARAGWPMRELLENGQRHKNAPFAVGGFLKRQLEQMNPLLAPLWLLGLGALTVGRWRAAGR